MKNGVFKEYIKPLVVLVVMCAIVAVSLAATNYITAPIIAGNNRAAAEAAREALLPGAESFVELDVDVAGVTEFYADSGGAGYVVTTEVKGYGGTITVMVGLTPGGVISGISADVSTETPGLGTKAGEVAYLDQYIGMGDGEIKVDTISGATYSSTAVTQAVESALAAYDQVSQNGADTDAESGATKGEEVA